MRLILAVLPVGRGRAVKSVACLGEHACRVYFMSVLSMTA